MKKIFLVIAFALVASVANAWNIHQDEGVVVLASKQLTPQTKALVDKYLGASYLDDVQYLTSLERKKTPLYGKEVHYLHLDSNLRPMKVEGDDALAALEEMVAILRARDSYPEQTITKALRVIINLMCDIHNLSNVRIEGVAHSQSDFDFQCYSGDVGKRKTLSKLKWSRFWNYYGGWHTGFSGNLWAEDLELCHGKNRAEFSKGTINDWVAQIGGEASKLYQRINPEYVMTRRERNELEYLNYEMVARASYRLAALLNETLK